SLAAAAAAGALRQLADEVARVHAAVEQVGRHFGDEERLAISRAAEDDDAAADAVGDGVGERFDRFRVAGVRFAGVEGHAVNALRGGDELLDEAAGAA